MAQVEKSFNNTRRLAKLGNEGGSAMHQIVETVKRFSPFTKKSVKDVHRLEALQEGVGKIPWQSWSKYSRVKVNGKEYAQVGDRLYTRHAADRMLPSGFGTPAGGGPGSGRSISPNFVEDVIRNGSIREVNVNGVQRTIHISGTVEVVTEQSGKIVVTVNPFKG